MIKDSQIHKEKYRVPYQECKLHSEKLNYICLDPECHENSLICSICREESKHVKHSIRPLKFYMQELQEKYSRSPKDDGLHSMLEDLEVKQYQFYEKLKKTVENIAEEFRKLEEEVTEKFNQIKNEIQEEISKRNRFNEFHESLKKGDVDLSNFLIQNYLPQASVGCISNLENLTTLSEEVCQSISDVKTSIFSRQQTDSTKWEKKEKNNSAFTLLDLKAVLKIPSNIYFDGTVLVQNQILNGSKSVCLVDFPIVNLSGKLLLKILQLKKGSSFIVGVVPKNVYESMNQLWTPGKLDNKSYVLGSDGYNKGWEKKEIAQFGQGSTLQLYYKEGELNLSQKNKSCTAKIPNETNFYVFFALIGDTQVRVTHIK